MLSDNEQIVVANVAALQGCYVGQMPIHFHFSTTIGTIQDTVFFLLQYSLN